MYDCSAKELEIGKAVLDKATKVAEYTGTASDSEKELGDVGALDQYYHDDWGVPSEYEKVFQEMEFQLITCKVTGDRGHVWVVYTRRMRDEDKKLIAGSWDILSLWEIEKRDEGWYVVKTCEAP